MKSTFLELTFACLVTASCATRRFNAGNETNYSAADYKTTECLQGGNPEKFVCGPFSTEVQEVCVAKSGGSACQSSRLPRDFFINSIAKSLKNPETSCILNDQMTAKCVVRFR